MKTKAIWLDVDPGHDDAAAIILAGHSPAIELLGISTTAGNQTIDKVTKNALQIINIAGLRHVGVVQGQGKPLMRPVRLFEGFPCSAFHGESGLELKNGNLPPTDLQPLPGKGVMVMFERILNYNRQSARKCHLVCTAPLTNAALLLTLYPEVEGLLEQIVLMGGAIGSGNTNPSAEFNIQVDPEAAKIVFESAVPLVMIPIEVTHTALATPSVIQRICAPRTPFLSLVREILLFFKDTNKSVFGFDSPPLHDPTAVAYVIAPHIFKVEKMRVDIETVSSLTAGQTVCDVWHMSPLPANATVAREMDVDHFWQMQIEAFHAADVVSPMNTQAGV